mgnify:FL=1
MTGSNRARTLGALIVVGMGVGAALTGCATDDSAAQERASASAASASAEAARATAAANAKFAADFVVADQQIVTKKGPARVAAFDTRAKLVCADSSMAQRLKKFKDAGKIETIKYLPDNETTILATHNSVTDPNKVVVVFRNNNAAQPAEKHRAIPIQIVLGEHAGSPCVSEWKSMGAGSPAESGLTGKEKFAAEFVTTSPITFVPPGKARAESFAKTKAMVCPGSAMAKNATQMQGQLDQYKYSPGFKIKVLTAFAGQNPSNVLVIAATAPLDAEAGKAKEGAASVYRIEVGDSAGAPCVSAQEVL